MGDSINSSNETCYDLQDVPKAALAVHALVATFIIVATVVGNGIILLLVAKFKVLRTRSVVTKLSLTCADVLWCLFFHVPAVVSASASRWVFGDIGCSAIGLFAVQFLLTRWLVLAVLCVDRFCTVRFPFSYTKYSKPVMGVLTITAWLLPFLLAFFPVILGLSHGEFRPNIPACLFRCDGVVCRLYYGMVLSSSFIVGAVIPTVLYVWLYCRARSLRPSAVILGQLALQPATGLITNHRLLPSSSYTDKWSRDIQSHLTFLLIVVTFIVTSLPAYLSQTYRTANMESWCRIPIYVHFFIQLVFLSSTALDPLVIMRDRDFRMCVKHVCSCWKTFPDDQSIHTVSDLRRTSVDILSPTSTGSNEEGLTTLGNSVTASHLHVNTLSPPPAQQTT